MMYGFLIKLKLFDLEMAGGPLGGLPKRGKKMNISDKLDEIRAKYGDWTAHNIELNRLVHNAKQ